MSDIAYRLLVDMSTKGSLGPQLTQMQGQAKGLDASFGRMTAGARSASAAFGSMGSAALSGISSAAAQFERIGDKAFDLAATTAKFGIAGGAAGVAYGVSLNAEMEQTKTSLAAIFKAQDIVGSLPQGLQLASSLIKDMRKDAAALPGEFQDLVGFFRLAATSAFQLGIKPQDLEQLSAKAMAAAATTGVQMDQAQRELAQLMQGRAGAHNVFGSMLGLDASFNQLSGKDRVKAISGALNKYDPKTFEGTYKAEHDTFKDTGKQLLTRATEPIFNSLTIELGRANQWLAKHEEQVGRFADTVGFKLQYGFELAHDKILQWKPAIVTFFDHAEERFLRLEQIAGPWLHRLEGLTIRALEDPATFDRLEEAAKLWGAMKVGNMGMPLVAPLAKGLAGGLEGGELAALGPAMGLLAIGALGAASALTNTSSVFHDFATKHAKQAGENLSATLGAKESASAFDKLSGYVRPVAEAFGTYLILEVESFTDKLHSASIAADFFTSNARGTWDQFRKDAAPLFWKDDPAPKLFDRDATLASQLADYNPTKFVNALAEREKSKTLTGAGGGGGGTTIQKVEIVVTSNQDPSRIARLTLDRLMEVPQRKTASRGVKNWSSERP